MPAQSRTQSHVRYPLTALLGSAGNVRVLRVLARTGLPLSAPQLAQQAGLTPQGCRVVLDGLAHQKVISVQGSGRSQLYALNPIHPMTHALLSLFVEELGRWDTLTARIRTVLNNQGPSIAGAWLYGSVARGEDGFDSDLDIAMLVSNQAVADEVRDALMPVEDEQQVNISVVALTAEELLALPEQDRWWSDVVRDARVLKGAAPDAARRALTKKAA